MNKTTLEFSVEILIPDFYIDYINCKSKDNLNWNDFHNKVDLGKLTKRFQSIIIEEYQLVYKDIIKDN